MTIWALEGVSFVGKTTVLHAIVSEISVEVIPEYHDLSVVGDALADIDAPSEVEEAIRVERYAELDEERWASALAWPRATTVLMDRCHISILAFSGALEDRLGMKVYDSTKRAIDRRLASAEWHIRNPDVVLFLRVSASEAIRRYQENAVNLPSFTLDPIFIECLCDRYLELVSAYAGRLIEINAERDIGEIIAEIRGIISV